jgi:hypothetical protein
MWLRSHLAQLLHRTLTGAGSIDPRPCNSRRVVLVRAARALHARSHLYHLQDPRSAPLRSVPPSASVSVFESRTQSLRSTTAAALLQAGQSRVATAILEIVVLPGSTPQARAVGGRVSVRHVCVPRFSKSRPSIEVRVEVGWARRALPLASQARP